ncbi:hypothetical protein ASPTUDRAFT_45887 [Aspergillus tubingensis CBS 134.48]|uniref:Uncharacterized protein n=1 Tax=Aspergillus tubingensis (strain CBS 134.48) TaxID=767770 RepID=A0A1L9MZG3_ASPTC|nr:hypothetical protein ASPTUDRAFT_45887 [Aspergillus tubingensis CBS 134.48]
MGSLVYAVLQKFSRYGTLGVSMGLLLGTFYYLLYVYTPTSILQMFFWLTVLAQHKEHCNSYYEPTPSKRVVGRVELG